MSVELLAPAGDFKTALSAFSAGADAVYLGLAGYSARAFAQNFDFTELEDIVRVARASGKKVYVAFNTLIDESELPDAVETLSRIEAIRPDAVILQDLGIARVCRRHFPSLELHASTQLVAHNLEGVLALKRAGFKRVVLARELSFGEISSIVRRCGDVEIEVFIHGALCYSVSGLCLYSAMEKGRSGNRGKCAYCCRLPRETGDGEKSHVYSMKDLRIGEDAVKLAEAGVKSLKIEGRMKSSVYVASAVAYYREILDGKARTVTTEDLETVFSRRTTRLYFDGAADGAVTDTGHPGHVGAYIGSVKKVTKDREGLLWMRFRTARALERHDGLQFDAFDDDGRRIGMGVGAMRLAISRRNEFSVPASSDVEILLPEDGVLAERLVPGTRVYCSASQAVRRRFTVPSFRRSDFPGAIPIDVRLSLSESAVTACANLDGENVEVSVPCTLAEARDPSKTRQGAEKAFSKLGETSYRLSGLEITGGEGLFAPPSVLNSLRRSLAAALDDVRDRRRAAAVERALADDGDRGMVTVLQSSPSTVVKIAAGSKIPFGEWSEVVVSVPGGKGVSADELPPHARLAVPVYTKESDFAGLRSSVKALMRRGFMKWEAADLATLSMLKGLGVSDITADWTLYAFNSRALAELSEAGVKRFVASPENSAGNLRCLAGSGYAVEFLAQQSTPLFISLTPPAAAADDLAVYRRGPLWVTVSPMPRVFETPPGAARRIDLSWDAPC